MTRRSAEVGAAMFAGAVAAGLGLGFLAFVVLMLWVTSPYPDSGPGGALHIVTDLWLLAHGADLVRTETRSGLPAPLGLTPLLLAAMPVWLLQRAAREAVATRDPRSELGAVATGAWLGGGYLVVALVGALYALSGPVRVDPLSAGLHLPVVVGLSVAAGVYAARTPRAGSPLRPGAPAAVALRAAAAGVLALLGGGALLFGGALMWHAPAAQQAFLQLTEPVSGRFAVLLLSLTLLPNAAVWAAAYGLGPGFAAGGGVVVSPLGVDGPVLLPVFPLLAAVPSGGGGGVLAWAAGLVAVAAGGTLGYFVGRAAAPVRGVREAAWSWATTLGVVVLAALGLGVAMIALASLAGGPLGVGRLAELGPRVWLVGAASLGWGLLVGVPVALAARALRVRA